MVLSRPPAAVIVLLVAAIASRCSAQGLAGKAIDPLRESGGKVSVLVFLRTDCPVSNRYAPTLKALSSRYAKRAKFWLIFPARSENARSIERYLVQYGYKLPAIQDRDLRFVRLAGATITPEAAVFSPKAELKYHGRIDNWFESAGRSRPAPTTHELSNAVEAVIAGRRPSVGTAPAVGCYMSDLE